MMTFSASAADLRLAACGAIAAAGLLAFVEWRRPNDQHRGWRVAASVAAVLALALLGLHPALRPKIPASHRPEEIVAALWTSGADVASAADTGVPPRYRIALPGAAAPPGWTVFPDTATLRRRFPEIATLHVLGDGLDLGELDALRGMRISFPASTTTRQAPAAIRFIHFPRMLALGDTLVVEGTVSGLQPGARPTLVLEAPDGSTVKTVGNAANDAGVADFTLRGDPPPATGHFLWRLRLIVTGGEAGPPTEAESLGIAVVPPTLPRVLALESSPRFDTADLRRWFAEAGGIFNSRTLVGQDRFRFASSSQGPAPEFARVDARLLENVDLVLTDAAALATLTPSEREALLTAITNTGLGLLTLADEAPPPGSQDARLVPWQWIPMADATSDEGEHLARPFWAGQTQPIATPIPAAQFLLGPLPGASVLILDGQGRTLAAAVPSGRGQVALTLLRDTGRWLRTNDPASFSAYWSFLFSRLARPLNVGTDAGRWALVENAGGPIFAGEPLTLLWSGAASADASADVVAESGAPQDNAGLALARDLAEPTHWRGTFWPRHPGWYRVSAPKGGAGPALDFFVDAADNWPTLVAARKRAATHRFAQASQSAKAPTNAPLSAKGNTTIPAICFFAIFLGGAGYLWTERRMTR